MRFSPNRRFFPCSTVWMTAGAVALMLSLPLRGEQPFYDRTHPSKVFGGERNYRIFLPPKYESGKKRYPVIYYFHGHSDRYTLERYDDGKDTVPKITRFVASNDVIVVAVDGYVAEHYQGFYGGSPWDVRQEGGDYDFGVYFQELVAHIDATYRTLTDRRHRATSGMSMGAFMSFALSARYPHLIASTSGFNPGPEFFMGEKGRRFLWRPKDNVLNHMHSWVRLIRAAGDYISQQHEETRDAYSRAHDVHFEYRQDDYHRHWATSIGETFAFHMRAFAASELDNVPEIFHHNNPYLSFEVWGYRVKVEREVKGLTLLEGVSQGGLRVRTRSWMPDGPPVPDARITLTTAPLYRAGKRYRLLDHNLSTGKTTERNVVADSEGRLTFRVDSAGHQVSFVGPGTGGQPTVKILQPTATVPKIEPGGVADLSGKLRARFTSGGGDFAPARLNLTVTYDEWVERRETVDLLIIPEVMPGPAELKILDGRTVTFRVFRQKGNQGGGTSIERTVTEGTGNGNGVLEPGEEATIWVRMAQGMDPFDKNNWSRTKVYTDSPSPWISEVADIQEVRQREWHGAKNRTSLVRLAADTPPGTSIPLVLENETWSFHYTPDVRYGSEPLYQAFQFHRTHLHRYELNIPSR